MSDLDNKRTEFEDRLNALAGKGARPANPAAEAEAGTQEAFSTELQERLKQWDASLDQRLEEFHRAHGLETYRRPVVEASARKGYQPDAGMVEWFDETEAMMLDELEWGRHPRPAGFQGGFEFVRSEEAMKTAISQACGLRQAPDGVHLKEYQLGAFHIPGRGTLINPSHYAGLESTGAGKPGDPAARATAVSDMAMERWGWGFLLEYTGIGQRAGAAGLWPAMLAERAGLPIHDPQAGEMARAIHEKWILLKTGWQDWVWQYIMYMAHHPVGKLVHRNRPARLFELIMRLQELVPLNINVDGIGVFSVRNIFDLIKFVFLENADNSPLLLKQTISTLHRICVEHDDLARPVLKMSFSRFIGSLYFSAVENQVGILATPYVVLLAGYEPQVDFASLASPAGFVDYVEKDLRHNPDARLAMLSRLDPRVKYDPRAVFTAAWERLKLEGPREYFA